MGDALTHPYHAVDLPEIGAAAGWAMSRSGGL